MSKGRTVRGVTGLLAVAVWLCLFGLAPETRADATRATTITHTELAERIQSDTAPFILDVRTPGEYAAGHIPGAVNVPHDELATRLGELPSDHSEEIVVHCQSGRRAQQAEAVLREHGYTHVRDLVGHWQAWSTAGLPVE